MGITTIALIDTDSDPDPVDLPIPGNDDSIRAIEVIVGKLADSILEGKASLPPEQQGNTRARPQSGGRPAANPAPTPPVAS